MCTKPGWNPTAMQQKIGDAGVLEGANSPRRSDLSHGVDFNDAARAPAARCALWHKPGDPFIERPPATARH
jgi:hypothetical protein